MKVAALIPAYNAEEFLPQCLDSILSQTAKDVSVYCCDDGSADGTVGVLADYAARHAQIHFVSQENGGVVSALNRLLDDLPEEIEAFLFVDADDYIHPEMVSCLAEALERYQADVAECRIVGVPAETVPPAGLSGKTGSSDRVIDDMSVYWLRKTSPAGWINKNNKLYRRSAVGQLRFRTGLAYEEDYFYGCEINAAIQRKVIVDGAFYAYRSNPSSVTSRVNFEKYAASVSERVRLILEVFVNANRVPPEFRDAYRRELAKDAYRMMIRKNLKKNHDVGQRRRLFLEAGGAMRAMETDYGLSPWGLNPLQRLIWNCCHKGWYMLARVLVYLT